MNFPEQRVIFFGAKAMMYEVRTGGLMRCCLATLDEAMQLIIDDDDKRPKEGDTLKCRYHGGGGMIFRDGAWEWNRDAEINTK